MNGYNGIVHLDGQFVKPDADCRCTVEILIAVVY